jgi:hypothetical protein
MADNQRDDNMDGIDDINDDIFKPNGTLQSNSNSPRWNHASLGTLSNHQHLKRAWSDDDSTVASTLGSLSSGGKYVRRDTNLTLPSFDESTVVSNQSTVKGGLPSFYDWLHFTKDVTDMANMVSKGINDCTQGAGDDVREQGFTLKDEDFIWNTTAQSFDTIDTRRTSTTWGDESVNSYQEDQVRKQFGNRRRNSFVS